jgi:hypothetical protein
MEGLATHILLLYYHKHNGADIDNPNNFENHKEACKDVARSPLVGLSSDELDNVYKPYYEWLKTNANEFPQELIEKYINHKLN